MEREEGDECECECESEGGVIGGGICGQGQQYEVTMQGDDASANYVPHSCFVTS